MIDFTALAQTAVLPVDCHHDANSAAPHLAVLVVYVIDNFPPPPSLAAATVNLADNFPPIPSK
jgi:hypothetical protein